MGSLLLGVVSAAPIKRTPAKTPRLRFDVGNYVERADGAIFVRFNKTTVYFTNNQVVAVVMPGVLYRSKEVSSGIIYRRVRSALAAHATNSKVYEIGQSELNALLEKAILDMAEAIINQKIDI